MKTVILAVTALAAATFGLTAAQSTADDQQTSTWMVVEHQVADVDAWTHMYNSVAGIRSSAGELSSTVHRDVNDPNTLIVVMEWDSVERASSFAADPVLTDGMRAAGVQSSANIGICTSSNQPDQNTAQTCKDVSVILSL